jgi:hypothetical protein
LCSDLARAFAKRLDQRHLRDPPGLLEFGVFRRVVEPPAQIRADQPDRDPEKEGQPPAPGEHGRLVDAIIEQGRGQRTEEKAAADADQLP